MTEHPPIPTWMLCDDCASTASAVETEDHTVMAILVQHSIPCPAWPDAGLEVAMALGADEAAISAALGADEAG